MKKVTFVELPVFERMMPLASGYLQAYATKDPFVRREYEFQQYTAVVKTPRQKLCATWPTPRPTSTRSVVTCGT